MKLFSDDHINVFIIFFHHVFFTGIFFKFFLVTENGLQGDAVFFNFRLIIILFVFKIINTTDQPVLIDQAVPVEEKQPNEKNKESDDIPVFEI